MYWFYYKSITKGESEAWYLKGTHKHLEYSILQSKNKNLMNV